ncbi:MAG: HRDC domain-containing protein [Lewinellaceae bacterium]|nr:HRDC domain-containing protein [Lewinellaceae bacterium]
MRIKIFSIPVVGGERLAQEMNAFLSSKKILEVDKQLVSQGQNAFWSFCITYIEGGVVLQPDKVDYREVLDEASFQRFARMRETRKRLAQEEGMPAYAIFSDKELAAMAKVERLTAAAMKEIKGVGEKKIEKYGQHFITKKEDEKKE